MMVEIRISFHLIQTSLQVLHENNKEVRGDGVLLPDLSLGINNLRKSSIEAEPVRNIVQIIHNPLNKVLGNTKLLHNSIQCQPIDHVIRFLQVNLKHTPRGTPFTVVTFTVEGCLVTTHNTPNNLVEPSNQNPRNHLIESSTH